MSNSVVEPARIEIAIEKTQFYGSPAFKDDGSMYIPNPSPTKYVGGPAAEVDKNWNDLIWGKAQLSYVRVDS